MISEFQTINWQTVISSEQDFSSTFSSFYNVMSTIIDKHILVKQLSRRERKFLLKPWITSALRKSLYVKNNLCKKFIKVAPYSFLTARELVSKSRDGASFKKSTRKSRVTSTTASNLHRSSLSNHRCSFPMC